MPNWHLNFVGQQIGASVPDYGVCRNSQRLHDFNGDFNGYGET